MSIIDAFITAKSYNMENIVFEPDEILEEEVLATPFKDEEKVDYQLNFIERLAAIETDLYDDMPEDIIKMISQCVQIIFKLQNKIKKSL
jgi:hypothetical protein